MRLWLVRHGPTHARSMIGWTDLPADLGDAAAIGRLSRALPDAPVVSSDLIRAVATADAISDRRPRLPHDPELREIHFGRWETAQFDAVWEAENTHARAFWDGDGSTAAPGGESWDRMANRVSGAIDRLATHHDSLIVVAHYGAILSQIQRATRQSAREVMARKIDNLSVSQIELTSDEARLIGINETP